MGFAFANQVADRGGGDQYFHSRNPPLFIDPFEQSLTNDGPDAVGQGGADLALFRCGKNFHDTVYGLCGAGGVQR